MKRNACGILIRERVPADTLVLCSLGTANRTWRTQGAPNLTYYASDPMGVALPMALGLALARPKQEVLMIGGDGDLVMGLGSLLTVSTAGAGNLKVIILRNGRYETGGSQPLALGDDVSLAAIARACGWGFAQSADDESSAASALTGLFAAKGPAFLELATDIEPSPYPAPGDSSQGEDRTLFMKALASR